MDDQIKTSWYRKIRNWILPFVRYGEAQAITRELWFELWSEIDDIFPYSLSQMKKVELLEWAMYVGIRPDDEPENCHFSVQKHLKLDEKPVWVKDIFVWPVSKALSHTFAEQLKIFLRDHIRQRAFLKVKRRIAEVDEIISKLQRVIHESIREQSLGRSFERHDLEYFGLSEKKVRQHEFNDLFFYSDPNVIAKLEARYKLTIHSMRAYTLLKPVAERLSPTVPSLSDKQARIGHQPDVYFLEPFLLRDILNSCSSTELSVIEGILSSNGNPAQIWKILIERIRSGALSTGGSDWKYHGSVIGNGPGMHSPFR